MLITHRVSHQKSCRAREQTSRRGSSVLRPRHTPTFAGERCQLAITAMCAHVRTPLGAPNQPPAAAKVTTHKILENSEVISYLADRLYRAYVGVWPEQNVLQLRLLLVDPLHRQSLRILLCLFHWVIFQKGLQDTP